MSYQQIMIQLHTGRSNTALLQAVALLGTRFKAGITGIAACRAVRVVYGENVYDNVSFSESLVHLNALLKQSETEFYSSLSSYEYGLQWRAAITPLKMADFIANEACSIDLLVASSQDSSPVEVATRSHISDLVMVAGRPVLVLPQQCKELKLQRALLLWKDSRESRRALMDALPLLQKCSYVAVATLAAAAETESARLRLDGIVVWLKQHLVQAWAVVKPIEQDEVTQLNRLVDEQEADLVIAGAYGHSRFRQWALGGVTRDLLMRTQHAVMLSH